MPRGTLTPERAARAVKRGLPDPLGLGDPSVWEPGRKKPWPVNTRRILSNGVNVKVEAQSNGRCETIPEHRLVMERELGRPLAADESARHKSTDRLDNRPENLMLFRKDRPVDLDAAVKRSRRRKPRRSTVYVLLPVDEDAERVRARSAREAEAQADYKAVAVPLSRLT